MVDDDFPLWVDIAAGALTIVSVMFVSAVAVGKYMRWNTARQSRPKDRE